MSEKQQPVEEPLERIGLRVLKLAYTHGHEYATLEHLLHSLLSEDEIVRLFGGLKVETAALTKRLEDYFESGMIPLLGATMAPVASALVEKLFFRAAATGKLSSKGRGDGVDLLISMLKEPPQDNLALSMLHRTGITEAAVKQYVTAEKHASPMGAPTVADDIKDRAAAEIYLGQYTANLNKRAAEGNIDPLIGRASEVEDAIQIFSRKKKNNPLLVGDSGVGKTAIAEGMAQMIISGAVPSTMRDTVIYSLDIGALIAGTKYRGDFEDRMNKVIKSLALIPKSVLFVDEIHMIMGAGSTSQGSMDAANLLKPALSNGSLRCIGSTTFEEYRKHFEKDRALVRRFQKITVNEPSVEDARKILHGLALGYSKHHDVMYTAAALDAAVDLTNRYVTTGKLPDKAIDIIDMAGARMAVNDHKTSNIIDVAEIEAEVSRVTKIPEKTVRDSETDKLGSLDTDLRAMVFGQDAAIETLTDAVFIARAGLREEDKTQGSYLFTGPTGVGKTEVAKQFASTLGIPLVRFDMSEYMEKHSVAKLVGAPPGYVGFGEGDAGSGLLTNAVEQTPHCVLLLDEIEKAHPDVYNLLLQVMDNGMLTNSAGKKVSFRNVWLIMTSNAGVREAAKAGIGFGASTTNESNGQAAINKLFAPEFRNRLDAQMSFVPLSAENIARVAEKFIDDLRTMVADRKVKIVVSEDAMAWLSQKGYDPANGARPMKRVIADHIKKPLSRMIVLGELSGGGKVAIGVKNDALTFKRTKR